jgi:ribosomal protein S14
MEATNMTTTTNNTEAQSTETACKFCGQVHPVLDGKRVFGCSREAFAPTTGQTASEKKASGRELARFRRSGFGGGSSEY